MSPDGPIYWMKFPAKSRCNEETLEVEAGVSWGISAEAFLLNNSYRSRTKPP